MEDDISESEDVKPQKQAPKQSKTMRRRQKKVENEDYELPTAEGWFSDEPSIVNSNHSNSKSIDKTTKKMQTGTGISTYVPVNPPLYESTSRTNQYNHGNYLNQSNLGAQSTFC
jgi:hypothetical protein